MHGCRRSLCATLRGKGSLPSSPHTHIHTSPAAHAHLSLPPISCLEQTKYNKIPSTSSYLWAFSNPFFCYYMGGLVINPTDRLSLQSRATWSLYRASLKHKEFLVMLQWSPLECLDHHLWSMDNETPSQLVLEVLSINGASLSHVGTVQGTHPGPVRG